MEILFRNKEDTWMLQDGQEKIIADFQIIQSIKCLGKFMS